MINQSPEDIKAALRQAVKDDMEIWMIAFNQLLDNRKSKCEKNVNSNINKLINIS